MAELVAAGYTPSELREMREALRTFREAYVEYLRDPSQVTKAGSRPVAWCRSGSDGTWFRPPWR
jgi:hypothetical protein